MSVKLQAKPVNIYIVHVYAPTPESSEEEVDYFYEQITGLVRIIPTKELLFLTGNLTKKIRSSNNDGHLRDLVGKCVRFKK